ncbi:hypothetical protein FOA52_006318 [Chlamydomonas sp. UWO 241]|nr:hypothetical protein FOA52_006318 [Chlamydomonas sp. UWO 241]
MPTAAAAAATTAPSPAAVKQEEAQAAPEEGSHGGGGAHGAPEPGGVGAPSSIGPVKVVVKDQRQGQGGASAPTSSSGPAKVVALPWMRVPITIQQGAGVPLGQVHGMAPGLAAALRSRMGFKELFPVQAAVWRESGGGTSSAHDLCVAAPTGSGKTLAYVLPVLNGLACQATGGSAHRLQALVVLPTRDLAQQVHAVFAQLCPSLGLTLGLAAASKGVGAEGAALVCAPQPPADSPLSLSPLLDAAAMLACGSLASSGAWMGGGGGGGSSGSGDSNSAHAPPPSACSPSSVDVLVATPGRLIAHVQGTPGFTLRHLKYLVVDETDRLLRQSYQEWLPRVLAELPGSCSGSLAVGAAAEQLPGSCGQRHGQLPFGTQRVVKLVVSATLTRDPSKLARLQLHCPRYIAANADDHRYHLPRSLKEFKLVVAGAQKPAALLALLEQLSGTPTMVFTSSLDTTHKLFLMLQAAHAQPDTVVEFSSSVDTKARARALHRFRSGAASVLVASDAMTRGMDVESVGAVVNYDAPVYAKTYVHRAGRTARAGRSGSVYSLLRPEDVRHFKAMLRKADNTFVSDHALPAELLVTARPRLVAALGQVQALLAAEAQQDGAQAGGGGGGGGWAKSQQPPSKRRKEIDGTI